MNMAGVGVTAIDIPMPGAGFFGANNHDASMLSESDLKAMVEAAMKVNPPKKWKTLCFWIC
jgi:hypothetical protein